MFSRKIPLFKILGFRISIDLSWFIIAFLVTWSLAVGVFPRAMPGYASATYWAMAVGGAFGFFFSIVFHEFWHSVVARRRGLPMKGITLFIFGGIAEMNAEPQSPKTELLVAAAGPLSSIVIGVAFYLLRAWGETAGWAPTVTVVLGYLAFINWILAAFNLIPAFPLDGGRILRSALWAWRNNLRWATKMASRTGSIFGLVLIGLGLLSFVMGNLVGGAWYVLIGIFLRGAASMSYRQVLIREAIGERKVRHLMSTEPVTVPPEITLQQFIEDYVYRHHHKTYPVMREGELVGCVTTTQLSAVPRERWRQTTVGEILRGCARENTVEPDADVLQAYEKMREGSVSRLLVTEGRRLLGILALKDIMGYLTVRMDVEGEGERGRPHRPPELEGT